MSGDTSSPARTVLILHGILGSGKNWHGFSRRLVKRMPGWQVVLPDLRHHGESRGFTGPHTVQACVEDLNVLCRRLDVAPAVVIGHSFGGKVALRFVEQAAWDVASVWALDTSPSLRGAGARGPGSEVGHVLSTLQGIPMPSPSRAAVEATLEAAGFSAAMRGWMTTNLRAVEGGVAWRFDLSAVDALIEDYFAIDLWPTLRRWPRASAVHLLSAGRGGRWTALDKTQARAIGAAGGLHYHVLADSGHWVHVDAPAALQDLFVDDLAQLARKMARVEGPE
ncbi:MAG: alpha/beta fold hydrolase [Myxococcota bacterium]